MTRREGGRITVARAIVGGTASALRDRSVRTLLGLTFAVIGLAAVFYHFVEGWAWVDAAYFATVTIATVGYGDFVPQTTAGKIFTMAYVTLGVGIFVAAAAALAEHVIWRARADREDAAAGARTKDAE
jgi:voltage-gated potassium channel Kch